MATIPHSNLKVAGSSLARSQCPYGSGFTPRLRLAGWRSARWDHLGGWGGRGKSPPPPPQLFLPPPLALGRNSSHTHPPSTLFLQPFYTYSMVLDAV
ncbi:hypothetical protein Hanom_Chr08g00727541 [Helianthus anomalus]